MKREEEKGLDDSYISKFYLHLIFDAFITFLYSQMSLLNKNNSSHPIHKLLNIWQYVA